MKRVRVQSSMIASYGYEATRSVLELEYLSGAVWQYIGVPPKVITQMKKAESFGRFINDNIKDEYEEVRIK